MAVVPFSFFTGSVHAQFNANFQTDTISGVTSNWSGEYIVGNSNAFDVLLIQSGGVVSNSGAGYIGFRKTG